VHPPIYWYLIGQRITHRLFLASRGQADGFLYRRRACAEICGVGGNRWRGSHVPTSSCSGTRELGRCGPDGGRTVAAVAAEIGTSRHRAIDAR
jgi:hypothetical protein